MGFYIFITEECEEEAKTHNCWDDVLRFRDKVIADQNTIRFDYFPPPFLKKRFRKQHRLVASERQIGEDTVLVFHHLLIRGNSRYNDFIDDPKAYGERYFSPQVEDWQLEAWLQEQRPGFPSPQKPAPNTAEQRYLWEVAARKTGQGSDLFIFESPHWIAQVEEGGLQALLPSICQALEEEVFTSAPFSGKTVVLPSNKETTLIGRYFPKAKWLFLAGIEEPNQDASELTQRYRSLLFEEEDDIDRGVLLRNSAKSYPALVLLDKDAWIRIQHNAASNLALSPEETGLLRSVHDMQDQQQQSTGFPLFINGRAGSGKSTILQYLFADYLAAHLRFGEEAVAPPVYLTYSRELVKKSRNVVEGLLKYGAHHAPEKLLDGQQSVVLESSFQEFHAFLLGLLDEEGKQRFIPGRFVNYRTFSRMWSKSFRINVPGGKDFGPELSWHVIRTYIKGMSVEEDLDVEDYKELPEGERSVPDQQFQLVNERIYQNWYLQRCKEEGYWDAQDLIRYLLKNELIIPRHPAVFCDEAQDFTRVELEALLRLNLFSDRTLTSQELERVPFAFAGDPLQTINPTGFRWEAIKSAFVQKFVRTLSPYAAAGYENKMNYRELQFNYRSSKHIIKLNNSIQALRSLLFEDYNVRPQQTWRLEERINWPAYFSVADPEVAQQIRQQLDLMIIVPCSKGEEQEFVEKDPYLSQWIDRDSTGVPRNVLSPGRAKGLEFERVIIYGFGAYLPEKPLYQLTFSEEWKRPAFNAEQQLSYEYFLNRLYVAASRPQRQLLVLDTEEGLKRLWGFAKEGNQQESMLRHLKYAEDTWAHQLGSLVPGTSHTWRQTPANPYLLAQRLEAEGRNGDPVLLRQAAMIWKQVEEPKQAAACLGFALEFEEDYFPAGKQFEEAGLPADALRMYWEAGAYKLITALPNSAKEYAPLQYNIASLISEGQSEGRAYVELLGGVKSAYNQGQWGTELRSSPAWEQALSKLMELLPDKHSEPDIDIVLGKQLHSLYSKGVQLHLPSLFRFLAKAGLQEEARELHVSSQDPLPQDVAEAYATMLLDVAEDTLTPSESRLLSKVYLQRKDFEKAAQLLYQHGDPQQYASLIQEELSHFGEVNDQVGQRIRELLEKQCQVGQWQQAAALCMEGSISALRGQHKEKVKQFVRDHKAVFNLVFIQEVALSATLPQQPKSQKQISEALSRLSKTSKSLMGDVHPIVLGAAYERAGNHLKAVKYYKKVVKKKAMEEPEKQFMRERLLASRLKRAAYIEEQEGEPERASRIRADTIKQATKWKVGRPVKTLPDYPVVNEWLSEPVFPEPKPAENGQKKAEAIPAPSANGQAISVGEYPDQEQVRLGALLITCSRKAGRVKIRHDNGLDDVSVRLYGGQLEVRSLDVEVEEKGGAGFWVPGWALRIMSRQGDVELHFQKRGTNLRFERITDSK